MKLTDKQRKALTSKEFAEPGKRKYPIEDKGHARDALSRVSANGTPAEKKEVRAKVKAKFPSMEDMAGKVVSNLLAKPLAESFNQSRRFRTTHDVPGSRSVREERFASQTKDINGTSFKRVTSDRWAGYCARFGQSYGTEPDPNTMDHYIGLPGGDRGPHIARVDYSGANPSYWVREFDPA